tara:strand:+ start:81 stop:461 length:381 start_codon:yes stop_codon:yes gene_type:complete
MKKQINKKWSKKDLDEFKKIILDKRSAVLKDLDIAKERTDEMKDSTSVNAIYSSHMADAGSDHEELEKNYYWMARENKFLQYLNRALEMIELGTFGVCKTCGNLIGKERLIEVPHTKSCFECKSKG